MVDDRWRVPPGPTGWLTTAEAAEQLGCPMRYVTRMVSEQRIPGVKHASRLWVHQDTVDEILAERGRWISYRAAAELLDVSDTHVAKLVRQGRLVSRHRARKASIDRSSVEALAPVLAAEAAERAARRAARRRGPPDDGHVWFDTATAALVIGVTANRVRQLSVEERVPFTERSGRRWYRRDHLEQIAAARAFGTQSRSRRGI